MQRYFVPDSNWMDHKVIITGDDAHHIARVMRLKKDDQIICNHPNGQAAICILQNVGPNEVHAIIYRWLERSAELPVQVTIAQGLPKSNKFEFVLQKGTELGADGFIPFRAARSVVVWDDKKTVKKMKRYEKILKEASEQSHRNKIPYIKAPMTIEELIDESVAYDIKLYAYEEEAKTSTFHSLSSVLQTLKNRERILVCIGPEGGFSPDEAKMLTDAGFHKVRLGPRILRTETASIYVLASISYHLEELGG
ncbi:MAG TPA: 16S rRNA (uracil(1498)-N(3))-methyltransferase [Bacillota bacterium]|nr:16S rRNA (uracil(1498)-N(3))-methyltransferase [Bacillota bacterium]